MPKPKDKENREKNRIYFTCFQPGWLTNIEYSKWIVKENEFTAKCRLCKTTFTIKHEGEKSVKDHMKTLKHQRLHNAQTSSQILTSFFAKKNSSEQLKTSVAELALVYHGINHHLSYLSTDCSIKLNSQVYKDSPLSKSIHCGKTKAEAIAENILGPKAVEIVINQLKEDDYNKTPRFFSISSDASNKGNVKIFPLIVTYYSKHDGIQNKILDFYSDDYETADAIVNKIIECINTAGLCIDNIVSFTADNANVNYGAHNSVFQKLTVRNPAILKSNCNCHVCHNCAKYACKKLSYDVEGFVNKLEFSQMVKNIPTRWISLLMAVDKILLCYPAIKLYFVQKGESYCDKLIWKFVKDQQNEITDDLSQPTLPELYLYLVQHFLTIMKQTVLVLQKHDLTSTEVHSIMVNIKAQLEQRLNDNFYGAKINNSIKNLNTYEKKKILEDCNIVYTRAIAYLNLWYDYKNSPFEPLMALNIKKDKLVYQNIIKAAQILNCTIDEDKLYSEIVLLNNELNKKADDIEKFSISELWSHLFRSTENLTEIYQIVSKALCIPVSNAFVERVFSIMGNIWTNNRNKMRLNIVKSEILAKVNFDMNCEQFLNWVQKNDQQHLVSCVPKQTKYNFKK